MQHHLHKRAYCYASIELLIIIRKSLVVYGYNTVAIGRDDTRPADKMNLHVCKYWAANRHGEHNSACRNGPVFKRYFARADLVSLTEDIWQSLAVKEL